MISIIRKNQQVLMIIVTILVIVAFVWLYNGVQWEKMGESRVAEAYGKPVERSQIEQRARKLNLAADLGLMEFSQILAGVGPEGQQGAENFVWNLMVVQHHADRLQIEPGDEEVVAQIMKLPAFLTNDQYDPQKYALFAESRLSPRGFSERQLQDLVRDQMRFERLKQLVGTTVAVPETKVREIFDRQNSMIEAQVVRLPRASVESEVQVTDDEVAAAFESQKDTLKSSEKRALTVAKFARPGEIKADEDPREKVRAIQRVADTAEGFGVKTVGEGVDFKAAAQEAGAEVIDVPPFPQSEPPEALGSSPLLAEAAFGLTPEQPVSSVQQVGPDVFYVLKLGQVEESKPLSFEQAKDKVRAKLRDQRIAERLSLKAAEVRQSIAKALEEGKSFEDAALASGLQPENFPAFSMSAPKFEAPDAPAVMQTAMTMEEKALSEPVPTQDGMLVVYVKARQPAPEGAFAKEKDGLRENLANNSRLLAFVEWLRQEREAADIRILAQ